MLNNPLDSNTTHLYEEEGWGNAASLVPGVRREVSLAPALQCVLYRWSTQRADAGLTPEEAKWAEAGE